MSAADWTTSLIAVAATAVAIVAAVFARKQARAAAEQVQWAREQVRIAAEQAQWAKEQVRVAENAAAVASKQAEAYSGAQSAVAWRDQVISLHDRGLSPGQIRFMMHLEAGGAGYEGWNGRIDDVVANLSSVPMSSPSAGAGTPNVMACDTMPRSPDGCTGPCKDVVRRSGCADFRVHDVGSPNVQQ